MIGRSHSPISSLDGQDQALKIPVGVVTLVSDVPRGGGSIVVYTRAVPGHLSTL